MPKESNITLGDEFFTGKDKVIQFTETASEDISTWALKWVLAKNSDRTQVLFSKTTVSGISITNGPDGVCQVTVTDDDTQGLKGSENPDYFHELSRTDSGNQDVLAYGTVVLRQSPTP